MGSDSAPDLDRLVLRCRRGDSGAWERLVRHFEALVYSTARRAGLAADDAEDVFQATFLALYRTLDRIEDARALPKWLAVTAARESVRVARLRGRWVQEGDEKGLDETIADEEARADVVAAQSLEARRLRQGLASLGGRCEQLLAALYFEELDYKAIQERLGMPVGAIGPTRARCLQKLKGLLAKAGFFSEDER